MTPRLANLVQRTSIDMTLNDTAAEPPRATNTPGRELAFARERLSLSLEEVSRRTKIGLPYLRAIENDDVTKLPGRFYARGFLRSYAHEVRCDADDIVRRFGIAPDEHVDHDDREAPLDLPVPVDIDDRRTSRRIQMVALAVLVSGGFYVASGKTLRPAALRPAATKAVATRPQSPRPTDTAAPVVATTGTRASTEPTAPASTAALSIDARSSNECWLAATADGQRVVYRLLAAGETVRIEARDEIVLRVGDAAAMAFAINGSAGRTLGAAGEAVTIRVTPGNYREFLRSSPPTDHTSAGTS